MGSPSPTMPEESIQDFGDYHSEMPAFHSTYTYLLRPKYEVRAEIHRRVEKFDMGPAPCAAMHVRRGDILLHRGQARAYLTVDTYVRAARPYLDALGINTILLLTDSQAAVDEGIACATEFPDICGDLTWRYVDKRRWVGGEGGWENPFPSGNSKDEFFNIQTEFALVQKCDMAILGDSGFGERIYAHMCCNYPLNRRGMKPQRCVCPPRVRLQQGGFDCKKGNKLMCSDADVGGDITRSLKDPSNMRGANFSLTDNAFAKSTSVNLHNMEGSMSFVLGQEKDDSQLKDRIHQSAEQARSVMCKQYDHGLARKRTIC